MKNENIEKANVAKVKEHLSAYVAKAEKGEKVVICRRNRPVAELVPINEPPASNMTKLGSAEGSITIKSDLTEPVINKVDWDMW
jgi:prevent-host-death family protein